MTHSHSHGHEHTHSAGGAHDDGAAGDEREHGYVNGTLGAMQDDAWDPSPTLSSATLSEAVLPTSVPTSSSSASALCLAVLRENSADVVLFDVSGQPRVFHYSGHNNQNDDISKLCFQTHGNAQHDNVLTPCFDAQGRHGTPDGDGCFCGVSTPHLHAHLRDARCESDGERDVNILATHVLYPAISNDDNDYGMLHIDVSERMPAECNSHELQRLNLAHKLASHRRLHAVRHDNHIDYLVHDALAGELHLEHLSCQSCGSDDVHGKFKNVGRRRWQRHGEPSGAVMEIQFFQVDTKPFSLKNWVQNSFALESDRVRAVDTLLDQVHDWHRQQQRCGGHEHGHGHGHLHDHHHHHKPQPPSPKAGKVSPKLETTTGTEANAPFIPTDEATDAGTDGTSVVAAPIVVRSTFVCPQICCAAEIPLVHDILDRVPGVQQVKINVPLKQVLVDHDANVLTAGTIGAVLDKEGFGGKLQSDGAAVAAAQSKVMKTKDTGRSAFYVAHICCASEIPAIESIVRPMHGVKEVAINVTNKMVYVNHALALISAQEICNALNREAFGAEIRQDASAQSQSQSVFCESTLNLPESSADPDTQILTSFLQTYEETQMESFIVDMRSKTISVTHNPFALTAAQICEALQAKTSIEATIALDGADVWKELEINVTEDDLPFEEERFTWPRPTVVLAGVFWIISMLHYLDGNWTYLEYVGLLSVAFGLPSIAIKAIRTMRRCQFDTNCLMFFASLGALGLRDYSEAAAVVFLFAGSEWLEVRATARARHALSSILQLRPEKANLLHPSTRELVTVPASAVPLGAIVCVKTGDKIPCDGVIVEGNSTVDESSLTGEARPVRKGVGENVSGGTLNSGRMQMLVRTTATAENSAVSRLIRLVEEAQANRSETEKLVDELARIYTPIVVFAALLMCTIPWAFGQSTGYDWTHNGLVLIVLACPCALIISTPVAYVAGLAATAQKGVLIKGGAHLEALGTCKAICFDKTGTITQGKFMLLELQTLGNEMDRQSVLQHLSLMEERASHPVAQAIISAAQNEGVGDTPSLTLTKHTILPGEGIVGVINGVEVYVGNERLFKRLELFDHLPPEINASIKSWKDIGGTVGFMSVENKGIVCAYCAADSPRPEAKEVIDRLKYHGVSLTMLTGDNRDAALAIGRSVGLAESEIRSELLPEDKLTFVRSLGAEQRGRSFLCNPFSRKGTVMMCGDGVNDAPALAAADIGVAMGAGAALAMETADVTLLDSNLAKLEYSILMGKRVIRKIIENVVFSLAVKVIVLGFALNGQNHIWAAIASDVGAMIIVTLNAMRLLPARQNEAAVAVLKGDIENAQHAKGSDNETRRHGSAAGAQCEKGCCQASTSTLACNDKSRTYTGKKKCCISGSCAEGNITRTAAVAAKSCANHCSTKAAGNVTTGSANECCSGPPSPHGHDHKHGHTASLDVHDNAHDHCCGHGR